MDAPGPVVAKASAFATLDVAAIALGADVLLGVAALALVAVSALAPRAPRPRGRDGTGWPDTLGDAPPSAPLVRAWFREARATDAGDDAELRAWWRAHRERTGD